MDIEKLIERLGENTDCWTDKVHGYADLRLEAATALSTLQAENAQLRAELEYVTAERNAAQALLAERSGVIGSAPITTAFGIPLERIRELVEADRMIGQEVWAQEKYLKIFREKSSLIQRTTIQYISLLKGGDILCHTKTCAFPLNEIGGTVFSTLAEAEEALRREQDGAT